MERPGRDQRARRHHGRPVGERVEIVKHRAVPGNISLTGTRLVDVVVLLLPAPDEESFTALGAFGFDAVPGVAVPLRAVEVDRRCAGAGGERYEISGDTRTGCSFVDADIGGKG
jgi:hypothetical protein